MAGKLQWDYPPDRECVELCAEAGSVVAAAERLGIPGPTFRHYLKRQGLMDEINERLKKPATLRAVPDPDEPPDESEILRAQLAEYEKAGRAQRKVDVLEERVLAAFDRAIEARKPTYKPKRVERKAPARHEFVLLWSDTHAGEVVSEVETNGLNAYDWKIMLERHDRIREAVFSYQDNRPYPVEKLHICGLGDMLSGDIHDELVETNEIPLAEATIQFAQDGAAFVESFLERFSTVNFSGVVGNHPRAKRKPQAKQAFNNADWLAYHAMRSYLRNEDRIAWDIPKASAHPIVVCGKRILLWHGDGVRSTMPGVPWGGVMRRGQALSGQYAAKGMPLDHLAVGHFHQANVVQQGRILMNGSVKGIDEYSLKAFGGGSEPQQLLLTFHPDRGLTDVSFVDC